ncbi:hypothetical protein HY734_00010 [Candidatus Uhrbacteria bacterium]|nr:hypothetical protein [Candidatus Uhrbacteria bacterium]
MKKIVFSLLLAAQVLLPFPSIAADTFNPNLLLSDEELTDAFSLELGDIGEFLKMGSLADYRTIDIDGKERYASEIIWRAGQRNGINPKFILVLLQKEQSLITDPDPSERQLDWATGYAICDDCSKDDPKLQRFRGFAKQINSATLEFKLGYLADLEERGETVVGFAPGKAMLIDDTVVVPANNATAALYTYTPHLHGNRNFVKLWQRWFTRAYPTGSLLQNAEDGGVWLIQYGKRRPITSRTALLSRYNPSLIISVDPSELQVYPSGTPISLPNYSLLHAQNGDIHLLVDDAVRHIVSMEVFRSVGFNEDELVDISDEDLAAYELGNPITADSLYPQGALLQDTSTGGVFYTENGVKRPIVSPAILRTRFKGRQIVSTSPEILASYPRGEPVLFPDGTLVGVEGQPAVYVISEGERRPIVNEGVFAGFGWKWENVVWTNEASVLLHPVGEQLSDTRVHDDEEDETDVQVAVSR